MTIFSVRSSSLLEHLLRLAGLLVLFGLVALGFWKNSERNMERINARFGLSDETKALSRDEEQHVQAFITALRAGYGIEARVQVRRDALDPPQPDGKTLFVGLSLEEKSALVQLPPLVQRALGPDFARRLETEHFPFHFGPGRRWQQGLVLALDLVQARLAGLGDPALHDTPPNNASPNNAPKDTP